jgi:phosphatidate phosphatase APP1
MYVCVCTGGVYYWCDWYHKMLHTLPNLLPGDFSSLRSLAGHMDGIRDKKIANFESYMMLYPDFSFVFFGDNGQADHQVAEEMLRRYPTRISACFIHAVRPVPLDIRQVRTRTMVRSVHVTLLVTDNGNATLPCRTTKPIGCSTAIRTFTVPFTRSNLD